MNMVSEQSAIMFQIVCLELNCRGDISRRWKLNPSYELWEDAMALAEFDASRCGGDYGYDDEHQCWWACDARGRSFRFVIDQIELATPLDPRSPEALATSP
jgi:hypothetical protein